ncbi:MAG: universal stress protein [Azospirillum sp.]|nr:universal stress protein [Azospirillum sp.]
MPIKTILLHMSDDEKHAARLMVAVGLARKFEAFLDILYVTTPVSMPAGMTGRGASFAYITEATAIAQEKAEQIETEVNQACKSVSFAWTVAEGDHAELLAGRAAFADLAIVTQAHPAYLEDQVILHLPDRLPLLAACPTLILPWRWQPFVPGRHILVVWRRSREAARALRDAMPFLWAAEKITVLTIDRPGPEDDDDGADLLVYLERHGLRCELVTVLGRHESGEEILSTAKELDCDAIVMGAYGHSRMLELLLGSATQTVLSHMHVPVLMSH